MKNLALVVVVSALASAQTAVAVPVVPNFTQSSMTSNTTTTSTVTETINSMDYNTGSAVFGNASGVVADGELTPTGTGSISNTQITLDGVTSTWNGLNLEERPNFTMQTLGGAFQFTETYHACFSNHTIIQRTTTIQIRHRHNFNLYTISTLVLSLLSPSISYAEVGGISATANPIANSSSSVTNQAIQVLQSLISRILMVMVSSAKVLP